MAKPKQRDRLREIYDRFEYFIVDDDDLTVIGMTPQGLAFFDVDWSGTGELGCTYILEIRKAKIEVE